MRITLPRIALSRAMRIGLLLAGLPAAAVAVGAAGAETPAADPAALVSAAHRPPPDERSIGGAVHEARLEFGFYALGAKAFNLRFGLQRDSDALAIDTEMQTFGLVDFLMSFAMTGHAAARIRDGHMLPVRYSTHSDGSWSKRSIRISWDAEGMPAAEVTPPIDQDEREPVPDALKRDTTDPITAIVARALHGGDDPPCGGMDAIFDGRRRYNLHYAPVGPAVMAQEDRSAYTGPAFECTVRLEPVAGYRRDDADTRSIEKRITRLWLARPPGVDVWVPVRIDSTLSFGSITGWIAGGSLNGRTWLAPLPPIRYEVQRPNTP
jgi:hypothetical protein